MIHVQRRHHKGRRLMITSSLGMDFVLMAAVVYLMITLSSSPSPATDNGLSNSVLSSVTAASVKIGILVAGYTKGSTADLMSLKPASA